MGDILTIINLIILFFGFHQYSLDIVSCIKSPTQIVFLRILQALGKNFIRYPRSLPLPSFFLLAASSTPRSAQAGRNRSRCIRAWWVLYLQQKAN